MFAFILVSMHSNMHIHLKLFYSLKHNKIHTCACIDFNVYAQQERWTDFLILYVSWHVNKHYFVCATRLIHVCMCFSKFSSSLNSALSPLFVYAWIFCFSLKLMWSWVFISNSDLLLDTIQNTDHVTSCEALIYCVGAVKFLTANSTILKKLAQLDSIKILANLMHKIIKSVCIILILLPSYIYHYYYYCYFHYYYFCDTTFTILLLPLFLSYQNLNYPKLNLTVILFLVYIRAYICFCLPTMLNEQVPVR